MFLLQCPPEKQSSKQKEEKRAPRDEKEILGKTRIRTARTTTKRKTPKRKYYFSFECASCLTQHKGIVESDTPQLYIQCIESMSEISVADDRFTLLTQLKARGITPLCNYINLVTGKPISKEMVEEEWGEHKKMVVKLEDMQPIMILERRARERSIYL